MVLDEPANHLDPALVRWLHAWLARRVAGGQGLIAVSHDLMLVTALEQLPGAPVQLLGIRDAELSFDCRSDVGDLAARLEALYGVPWVEMAVSGQRYLLPDGAVS